MSLTLQIWNPADKAGVQTAVDGFEEANPNISVTLEQVPEDQYYTKLDASLGAGEGPDVMWQSSRASYYVEGGAIEPLDEYIERDNLSLTDLYPEQLANLYNFDGQQYGIPKDQDVWMVIYNTAVFSQLGVTDLPTVDWTWDDMVRIAEEVKAKQTTGNPMYYNYAFNNGVAGITHQLGGTVVEDDKGASSSPEGVEAFGMIKDLQDRGLILPVADSGDFNAPTALISGNIAFAKIPSWSLSLLSKADAPEGTFVAVPQPEINGSRATDTNGLSYVMNANSAHKDESWELIKFLTSDEGATLHAEGGAAQPANLSDDVKAAYFEANKNVAGLKETFDATIPDQFLRPTTEYPAVRSIMAEVESTVTGPYYAGNLSAEEATKNADALLTKALSE
ncbi:sugar ABC transporter substrate-binding protein [Rathayibacter festucae]|uniref:ABC transporter substrate-binding protein n=1 Tax=Rathayibacter festucae TaxID=110937 RepID=UPI001FB4EC37|nr:sugar ABC transporter substrate-binding protein [Rathayibacter festucae]MCJ1702102.1 sugar ABC transporter substrate-binding protein [Rathayibacter festucae]